MAKKVYIGVGGTARKVKKMYFGVDGKARKVKKAYIGVGGKARPFWTGGELTYYAVCDSPLKTGACGIYGLSNSKYALFVGGQRKSANPNSYGNAYDASLTLTASADLAVASYDGGYTRLSDYCIFAGGRNGASAAVDLINSGKAINASLTATSISLSRSREGIGSASVGNYAIFHAGYHHGAGSTSSADYNHVERFDTSLTKSTSTSATAGAHAGASTASYAIMCNGSNAYAYNSSLTINTISTAVSCDRVGGTGITFGGYAIYHRVSGKTVPAFNNSLTLNAAILTLSSERIDVAYGVIEETLIAAGGYDSSLAKAEGRYSKIVDSFDKSFTRKVITSLSTGGREPAAAAIGNYLLVAGGQYYTDDTHYSNVVDVYTV